MPNALYRKIHHRMHHPKGPYTDAARQMKEDLSNPKADTSPGVGKDGVTLHRDIPNESTVERFQRPSKEQVWQAFRDAAKPGDTTTSEQRLISAMTFGPESQDVRDPEAVPLSRVEFRRGFALTAEETGVRIAGSLSGFVAGATLELTQDGVHLKTDDVTQTFSYHHQRIETHNASHQGPADGSFSISHNGTFSGKYDGEFYANRETRYNGKGEVTEKIINRVNDQGQIEAGGAVFSGIINNNDVKFIRPEDAADAIGRAHHQAEDAFEYARDAWTRTPMRHRPLTNDGQVIARSAYEMAGEAEDLLESGALWDAEAKADDSSDLSSDSRSRTNDFRRSVRRAESEEARAHWRAARERREERERRW